MKRPLCLAALWICLVFFLGVYSGKMQGSMSEQTDREQVVFTGKVVEKGYRKQSYDNTEVLRLTLKAGKQKVLVDCKPNTGKPFMGQTIRVSGIVRTFSKATNPGEFDAAQYYQILGISYQIQKAVIVAASENKSLYDEILYRIKEKMAETLDACFPDKEASILKTMLLGDKTDLDTEIKELYQESGIIHVLAISGLHISLLGMGFYRLLEKIRMPRFLSISFCLFFIFSYGRMTGGGISGKRAIFMFVMGVSAPLLGRTYDMLTALSLVGFLMLLEQPLLLKHSGFLLSFGAVLSLAVLYGEWTNLFPEWMGNIKNKILKILADGFLAGSCIACFTLPILLSFYYTFSPYSLLLNLLVIPLMGILLPDGILSILLGLWSVKMGSFIGMPDRFLLFLYELSGRFTQMLPGSMLILGKPKLWQVIIYYAILAGWIVFGKKVSLYLRIQILLCAFSLLLFRPCVGLSVTMLDVGQGDGIVIHNDNGNAYLVDGGSSSKSDVGKYQILPFLKSEGISELEAVIISHSDSDHMSGIMTILEEAKKNHFRVKRMLLPVVSNEMKEEYKELTEMAQLCDINVIYMKKGEKLKDGKLEITWLSPDANKLTNEVNEMSQVQLLEYEDFSMLLTGDVCGEPEQEVGEFLKTKEPVTVLKVAHHGSKNSTPEEFLSAVKPRYAIISVGAKNRYGHPGEETLDRLEDAGAEVIRTDEEGAIILKVHRGRFFIKGMNKNSLVISGDILYTERGLK